MASDPAVEGIEPDHRFSLANERTFLAWVRTSLALMASAVAAAKLLPGHDLIWMRRTLGAILGAGGLLVALTAYGRYRAVETAIRQGRPLPSTVVVPLLAGSLVVASALAVVLVLTG